MNGNEYATVRNIDMIRRLSLKLWLALALVCLMANPCSGGELDPIKPILEVRPFAQLNLLKTSAKSIDWHQPNAPRVLFDLILKEYFKDSSPEVLDALKDVVRKFDQGQLIDHAPAEGKGWPGAIEITMTVDLVTGKLTGLFPTELRHTILEYGYLIHELDHIFVAQLMKRVITLDLLRALNTSPMETAYHVFNLERRAIYLEWLYLHLVDPTFRHQTYTDLMRRIFPDSFKKANLRWLKNAYKTFPEFLELEHRADRYAPDRYNANYESDEKLLNQAKQNARRCADLISI